MLKHMPSERTAVNQLQQQQQNQQSQSQRFATVSKHFQSVFFSNEFPKFSFDFDYFKKHPKHPPPPPPQIQSRIAAAAATRALLNRSIQPLNVSTISHHTAPSIVLTPTKLIPNGHANGSLRSMPPQAPSSQMLNTTPLTSCSSQQNHCSLQMNVKHRIGAREALTSLGLLCLGMCCTKLMHLFANNIKF